MSSKESTIQKSFNGLVYQKTYKRLNLSPVERTIYQRLLGFLIRNNKSFPFSVVKLSELTGFSKSTIFRSLNRLEFLRLITREGLGKNRRFSRGSILNKILTTVSNRIKQDQYKNLTTVSLCDKNSLNRVTVTYKKTSSSLKRKERDFFEPIKINPKAQEEAHDKRMREYEEIIKNRKKG